MKVVQIVGPYRGDTHIEVQHNIREAEKAAKRVWQAGAVAICPHLNSRLFGGICSEEHFLSGYLELITRVDAILTVPGWWRSTGSEAELKFASFLGKPIYHTAEELEQWLQRQENVQIGSRLSESSSKKQNPQDISGSGQDSLQSQVPCSEKSGLLSD